MANITEELMKAPLTRTLALTSIIILSLFPGIYFFWLSRPGDFQQMDLFKLILLACGLNLLLIVGLLMLVTLLVMVQTFLGVLCGDDPESDIEIKNVIERSIVYLTFTCAMTVTYIFFNIYFTDSNFTIQSVSENAKHGLISVLIGVFADIPFRVIKLIFMAVRKISHVIPWK